MDDSVGTALIEHHVERVQDEAGVQMAGMVGLRQFKSVPDLLAFHSDSIGLKGGGCRC